MSFKKRNSVDYQGSSKHLKKKFDIYKVVNVRIKFFILALLAMAFILIYRAYTVMIVNADHYESLLLVQNSSTIKNTTMSGEIYDRDNEIIVSNKAINSIVYENKGSVEDALAVGQNFVDYFNMENVDLNDHDMRLLWLDLNPDVSLLSEEEEEELSGAAELEAKMNNITPEMLDAITEDDKKAFQIKVLIESTSLGDSITIKENVTKEEISYLTEKSNEYPGFTYKTAWGRSTTDRIDIDTIIGATGPIPYEKIDYYLEQGYARNDVVGTYGLEYQYEDLIRGKKTEYTKKEDGSLEMINNGRKGYDLVTSIDMDLQAYVEKALTDTLKSTEGDSRRYISEEILMVVSDPRNGDILALADMMRLSDGSYTNDTQGIFLKSYPVGSVVKGATVYMGLDSGAISPGETIIDEPMYIQGTNPRASYVNLGAVDDVSALQKSSNIYMFHIAIKLGGSQYIQNEPLVFPNSQETYAKMRSYYSQFGLGTNTMVDYPREETGYKGSTNESGQILELAIGQFDSYTTLQLSQYINTIANSGYRVAPRLVTKAIDHDTKETVYENNVEILNSLDNKDAIDRVRNGLQLCVTTSNCGAMNTLSTSAGAKTGTAQDFKGGLEVVNSTFIAFAPYDNPEVSIACIAPSAGTYIGDNLENYCRNLTVQVMDYYIKENNVKG